MSIMILGFAFNYDNNEHFKIEVWTKVCKGIQPTRGMISYPLRTINQHISNWYRSFKKHGEQLIVKDNQLICVFDFYLA